jgi:hypothetical protein
MLTWVIMSLVLREFVAKSNNKSQYRRVFQVFEKLLNKIEFIYSLNAIVSNLIIPHCCFFVRKLLTIHIHMFLLILIFAYMLNAFKYNLFLTIVFL